MNSSTMSITDIDAPPSSATFGQDASFRLEQPIGAMSISPSGRDVVLASKEGLHIIDLDDPYSPPRYLPHRTPWEVADVQWSPFAVRDYWVVSTSNQKALVWNVGISGWRDSIEHVLHGHSRAITDINFSAHDPDILATCAVDSFVHAWDLRAPARPAISFSDWFAGATQVKWSRQDEHVIASSHDKFLHIWDKRKGAIPARTYKAHDTKIYGIDWNRFEPSKIVTCSLDRTIKFWNTDIADDVPERIIETDFPVWRARHTPFGWGLLAMPQRGDSGLHLYDRRPSINGAVTPNVTFSGHKGQVREFLWRARGTIKDGVDHRDFQLVSWGDDGELRLHSVGANTFQSVGYEKGVSRHLRHNFTRRNARYRTFRDDVYEAYSPIDGTARMDSMQSHLPFGTRTRPSTSVAMNKISVAQFRGWVQGGKRGRRTGMHGRSTVRQDMNPIAWMKNVKIASWNSDSLADEITQLEERFSKLEFESVDINQRKAIISLQGPWGENRAMIYTRVEFRFPRLYPKDAAASVNIYKTSSVDEQLHQTLSTDANAIAQAYASRQRGCMEAIVEYLMNEQDIQLIIRRLLGESTDTSKDGYSPEMSGEISSDSDDDNINSNANPSHSSANLRVPLAKGCGALWSNTGQLVCFFPPKPKEPTSILTKFGASGLADSQTNRLFEGFGRLQTSSPARRPANRIQPATDDSDSDLSDPISSFSGSSSSEPDSESDAGIRERFAPFGGTINLGMRLRSRSADRSNKSTTLDGTKAGEESRANVISIHYDMDDLLPAKKSLAEQYHIFGPSSAVCDHNASVTEDAALPDISSVWRLGSLILQQRVPLEIMKSIRTSEDDFTVVMKHDASQLRHKDSGIDLSFDNQSGAGIIGGIRWGNNPLGSRYLITAIFNYFERRADIQMLAMLSCVFDRLHESGPHTGQDGEEMMSRMRRTSYQPSIEVADSLSRSQDSPSNTFTIAVTRPGAVAMREASHDTIVPASREPQHRRRNTATVAFRPDLGRHNDHSPHDNDDAVENYGIRAPASKSNPNTHATTTPASTSPEESRFNRRSNSSIAFAASRASLNALAQSFQNSPPSNNSTAGSSFKKFSPSTSSGWAGSLFGTAQNSRSTRASQAPSETNSDEASNSNLRGSVSLVNLQDLRRDSRRIRDSRGSIRNTTANTNDKAGTTSKKKSRKIKTSLHNQNKFDLDGHSELPLLDPDQRWKYRMYRLAYADQLGAWGLFLQRAELLQFEGEDCSIPPQQWQRGSGGRPAAIPSSRLEMAKCCMECGSAFAAIEKNGIPIGWHCATVSCHVSSQKFSKNQICSICEQIVRGLSVPCLQCGHITCQTCAQEWFSSSIVSNSDDDTESEADELPVTTAPQLNPCPTGCGCPCPTLQTIAVPHPRTHTTDLDSRRLDVLPTTFTRQDSSMSVRSQRHKSEGIPGPDTAIGAMLALTRSRAASAATTRMAAVAEHSTHGAAAGEEDMDSEGYDALVPWAKGKFTSLGRGIGGGLSRGLSHRSSDATIRKL